MDRQSVGLMPKRAKQTRARWVALGVVVTLLMALMPFGPAAAQTQPGAPAGADPYGYPQRTAMVHLFEWKWTDIALECENYLGPMGYAAVQVSPPQEHAWLSVNGEYPWWLRYQPVTYRLQSRSGTLEEFQDMIDRCHAVGVGIYVDAVINHMTGVSATNDGGRQGYPGDATGTTYYPYYNPEEPTRDMERLFYPYIDPINSTNVYTSEYVYNHEDFHYNCRENGYDIPDNAYRFNAWQVRNCELVNLADLATERADVRQRLADYLNRLVDMGVAGFRIDAAKHMEPDDIQAILNLLHERPLGYGGGEPYVFQEVIDRGPINDTRDESVDKGEYDEIAAVTEFSYSETLGDHLARWNDRTPGLGTDGNHINNFGKPENTPLNPNDEPQEMGPGWGYLNGTEAVVFVSNHDNQRAPDHERYALNFRDAEYQNANVFMLAWPYGYPKVMSSYAFTYFDQGPPADAQGFTASVYQADGSSNCMSRDEALTAESGWVCEHRWPSIAGMVGFRNYVVGEEVNWHIVGNVDQIAFSRGNKGFVAINNDPFAQLSLSNVLTDLGDGYYCNVMSGLPVDNCRDALVRVQDHRVKTFDPNTRTWVAASVPANGALAIHVGAHVPEFADVQVTQTASRLSAVPGQTITYRVTVRNTDDMFTAHDVNLVDYLRYNVGPFSYRTSWGTGILGNVSFVVDNDDSECSLNNGVINCNLRDLAPGASRTITIRGTVSYCYLQSYKKTIQLHAIADVDVANDPDQDNNVAVKTTRVTGTPCIVLPPTPTPIPLPTLRPFVPIIPVTPAP